MTKNEWDKYYTLFDDKVLVNVKMIYRHVIGEKKQFGKIVVYHLKNFHKNNKNIYISAEAEDPFRKKYVYRLIGQ